jgi:uncharacterized protein (TIGR03435 family)
MRDLLALITMATLSCSLAASARTQAPAPSSVAFEVASVKANTSGSQSISLGATPGGYTAINVPLRLLVQSAYGLRQAQVTGGPDWINVNRFDVAARAREGTPRNAIMTMLQTLLEERFKLVARIETREQPIYALVLSRSDGRLGPQLKASAIACAPGISSNPCRLSGTIGTIAGSVQASGQTMTELATYLGQNADRLVVDRTGLNGRFDFDLAWTAETLSAGSPRAANNPSPQNERAALFTALQEQLGLRLESTRGPVQVLVIDHAELPAPD